MSGATFTDADRYARGVVETALALHSQVVGTGDHFFDDESFLAAVAWLAWRTSDGWLRETSPASFPGGSGAVSLFRARVRDMAREALADALYSHQWRDIRERRGPDWVEARSFCPAVAW